MKITNYNLLVRVNGLFIAEPIPQPTTIFVTDLNNPVIEFTRNMRPTLIRSICFDCSRDEFTKLPLEILESCLNLICEYRHCTKFKFAKNSEGKSRNEPIDCAASWLKLIIESKASHDYNMLIVLNLMNSINDAKSIEEMPESVTEDISKCLYTYIKANSYSEFAEAFQEAFLLDKSQTSALVNFTASLFISVFCVLGLAKSSEKSGMQISALGLGALSPFITAKMLLQPAFNAPHGIIDFENVSNRTKLANLYRNLGGGYEYQLFNGWLGNAGRTPRLQY